MNKKDRSELLRNGKIILRATKRPDAYWQISTYTYAGGWALHQPAFIRNNKEECDDEIARYVEKQPIYIIHDK